MDATDGICTDTYVYDADCLTSTNPPLAPLGQSDLPATGSDPTAALFLGAALVASGIVALMVRRARA